MVGFIVSVLFLIVFSLWGEKLVLYYAKARYVSDDEVLINQVKNFSCHLGLKEVKIFSSATFANNVYFTQAYYGRPTLIIGKNIFLSLSRKELNSLIYASLLRLKSRDSCRRTMVSLIILVLFSPVYFIRKIAARNLKPYLDIFLFPGYFLKNIIYTNPSIAMALDMEVAQLEGLRKEYISAIFKLSRMEASSTLTPGDFILYELSHIPNKERGVLFDIVMGEQNTNERIEALAGF